MECLAHSNPPHDYYKQNSILRFDSSQVIFNLSDGIENY